MDRWLYFLDAYSNSYRNDSVLPRGVARLCEHTLRSTSIPDRRTVAASLAQVIEKGEPSLRQLLGERVEQLRRVR
jgi:hypothetical protein